MKHPDEALQFIKKTLHTHLPDPSYRFFLFGSRVIGDAHPYSDFDTRKNQGACRRLKKAEKILKDE